MNQEDDVSKTTQIYVLRVWQEAREAPSWRASLTDLSSQEKHHFASPEGLIHFVEALLGAGQAGEKYGQGLHKMTDHY
jgi:hypothetical protein